MKKAAIGYQNRPNRSILLSIGLIFLASTVSFSQSKLDSLFSKLDPQKFASSISKKAEKLEEKLVKKSLQTLNKLQKQEEKIYRKPLSTKDSLEAKARLAEIQTKYSGLKDKIKNPVVIGLATKYIPTLDSFSTAMKFLNENGIGGKVKDALAKTESLKDKFNQAEEIKRIIKERKEQLKAQLEKLGLVKELKQINKQVYYYAAQVKEYKEILKDPKKFEKKALELLSKTALFKDFFRKNSMLASLFRLPSPDEPLNPASLAGLQTRVQVNNLIQQQIAGAGPNGMQQFRQNMQNAQGQLTQLKNRIGKFGGGSSDDDMPEGFRANPEKVKGFLKRLEISANIQTQKSTNFFPATSDIGISIGYKWDDKKVIGGGLSYKLGLGRGWEHIKITHEGAALRSFIDWKLKGSIWITGAYEMNYRTAFKDFDQLKDLSGWQRSGLLGLTKTVPIKSTFFKKTKVSILWDFLARTQRPPAQNFIFRIGYNLK